MHAKGRLRVLITVFAALLMMLGGGQVAVAAEEVGEKNLSEPLLFAEADGADDFQFPELNPGELEGQPSYPADNPVYYVVTDPLVRFSAEHAVATTPVSVTADWGDNLTNHSFRGNLKQPIRVEMAFWASGTTMQGYEPVLLEGSRGTELYGITGEVSNRTPLVYTVGEHLTIERLVDGAPAEVIYGGPMTAEVNAAGKVIFGFNWGTPSGLEPVAAGEYRLTVTVPDTLEISGVGASELFHPEVVDEQTTTLDIIIGKAPGKKPPENGGGGGGGVGPPPDRGGGGGGRPR